MIIFSGFRKGFDINFIFYIALCLQALSSNNRCIDIVLTKDSQNVIDSILSKFNPKWSEIIFLRFGLNGTYLSLKDIAKSLNISSARVRKIESEAFLKLYSEIKFNKCAKDLAQLKENCKFSFDDILNLDDPFDDER